MRVYLDPGHGGPDRGGRARPGLDEARLNLAIALAAAERLRQVPGVEVRLARGTDQVPPPGDSTSELRRRTREANDWGAHCYVSIHNNSMGGTGSASGVETYVQQASEASQDLGRRVHQAVLGVMRLADRGVRTRDLDDGRIHRLGDGGDRDVDADYYAVLRWCRVPAIIVECGYMDHPTDADLLRRPEVLQALGEAIAGAVVEWGRARGLLPSQPLAPPADWRAQAIAEARAAGILTSDHAPDAPALVAHLAAVALRLHRRIEELERKVRQLERSR